MSEIDQALAHHQAGRLDQAEAIYRQILTREPENPDALHLLGLLSHQCGDHETAVTRIEQAIERRPQVAMYHNNLGEALRALGKYAQAVVAYRQALSVKPDYAAAQNNLGLALEALGQFPEALAAFMQSLAISPDARVHCNAGHLLRSQGRLEEATAAYEAAVSLQPGLAEAHNDLGGVCLQQHDTARATLSFRQAISLNPGFAEAYSNLGMALQQRENFAEAVAAFEQAIRHRPRAETYCHLGDAFRRQHRLADATAAYRRSIELKPDFAEAYHRLGAVLREQKDYTGAVAAYRQAIELKPDQAETHNDLGIALKDQDELDAAILAYQRAVALKPDYAAAYFNLGNAYRRQGKLGDAIAAYEKAVHCEPGFANARASIARVLTQQNRFEEACEAYHQLFRVTHGNPLWDAQQFRIETPAEDALPAKLIQTNRFELTSTIEQLGHLLSENKIDPSFQQMLSLYESILPELDSTAGETDSVTLTPAQTARIASFHQKVIHYSDTPRVLPHAINPDLRFKEIENAYLASPVAVIHFDEFLTEEALRKLWQFCLDSTIFFARGAGRILTSYLGAGFHSSLLFQIAAELKQCLPRILGSQTLGNMWAYRYPQMGKGVSTHADEGAVTFNFWITPDEANLEPGSGGLIVYAKEQPLDWDWRRLNLQKDDPAVQATLKEFLRSAEEVNIPYRQNRAVLFHSNLFHCSDYFHFKAGHRYQRTNITILFGDLGTDVRRQHLE